MKPSIWFFTAVATAACFLADSPLRAAEASTGAIIANRAPLQANAFDPLPLGAVHPRGWLKQQLEIQAAGLTGHLDEFWNDVGPNSGWLGGTGESWERGPYYLDGLLPLAYQLDDPKLIAKAKQWVDWTLMHQRADGQIGPLSNDDWWPRMVMLKVLTQYAEVSGDPRVIPLLSKYFRYELASLPARPLRDWGKYRWQDNVYAVLWLYNRTGEKSLLQLARLLHDQGYDWEAQFAQFRYTGKQTIEGLGLDHKGMPSEAAMQTHGVNNAMALKVAPIWWLVSGSPGDRDALHKQLAALDKYHGLPNGMFSGDEHLAGPDPSQGIELCAVVESMFSLEESFAILGDPRLADRLERIAYNALPATLSDDMWSHQYDQQPNQIACTRAKRQWSTNGDESNLFGLAPHFGCCTANLHQGWPKLVSSLWMAAAGEKGLAVTAYGPSTVQTSLRGHAVSIDEETEYPFRGTAHFTVHTESPAHFAIDLRLPEWAASAQLQVNHGKPQTMTTAQFANGYHALDRAWHDGDTVAISFPMEPRSAHSYHGSAVFERGPLVFSLPLKADWTELKKYAEKSADWQLTATAKWNYAVETAGCLPAVEKHPLTSTPFNAAQPPLVMRVQGRPLPQWIESMNSAGPLPLSPVRSNSALETLDLIPYGAAKLRITAFPVLADAPPCRSSTQSAALR